MTAARSRQGQQALEYYLANATSLSLDSQEFRALLLRADVQDPRDRVLPIDGLAKTIEWRAEPGDPVLQGTLEVQFPDVGGALKLHEGHVLKLDCRWGGAWREVWRMGLYDEQLSLDGSRSYTLYDDGRRLQDSDDVFHFSRSAKKGKPKGWLCHEVAVFVAKRYRIPVGRIAMGSHYMAFSGQMSPMQALQKAYAIERRATGKRFVIRWQNGKMHVIPLRRNPTVMVLGELIEDAAIGKQPRDERFATAVTVRGSIGKGKKRERVDYQYADPAAVAKEGFVHKVLDATDVRDDADAERKAKRYILAHGRRARTITGLQHRGAAFLRRGDALAVSIPRYGFSGRLGMAFVSSGRWTLASGDFTMSLDLTFVDPFKTKPKPHHKARK